MLLLNQIPIISMIDKPAIAAMIPTTTRSASIMPTIANCALKKLALFLLLESTAKTIIMINGIMRNENAERKIQPMYELIFVTGAVSGC